MKEPTAYSSCNKKSKNSAWKLKDGEQWKRSTKRNITLRRLKWVQYCIQLTIAKNEKFSK